MASVFMAASHCDLYGPRLARPAPPRFQTPFRPRSDRPDFCRSPPMLEGLGHKLPGEFVTYQFDTFTLDTARRELRKAGELVAVEPQVFDLLTFLIQARDRVVSRDDLLEAVWR